MAEEIVGPPEELVGPLPRSPEHWWEWLTLSYYDIWRTQQVQDGLKAAAAEYDSMSNAFNDAIGADNLKELADRGGIITEGTDDAL